MNVAVGYQEVVGKLLPAYGGASALMLPLHRHFQNVLTEENLELPLQNWLRTGTDAVAQWQKLMAELKPMSDVPCPTRMLHRMFDGFLNPTATYGKAS